MTVTLPEDILERLTTINADIGTAIVRVIEKRMVRSVAPVAPAEISRYGTHAVIVVTPVRALRRLKGVQLVPIGGGRALISLDPTHSVSRLELQLRDALGNQGTKGQEREVLALIAEILRRARDARGQTLETRNIIVLAAKRSAVAA